MIRGTREEVRTYVAADGKVAAGVWRVKLAELHRWVELLVEVLVVGRGEALCQRRGNKKILSLFWVEVANQAADVGPEIVPRGHMDYIIAREPARGNAAAARPS